MKWLFTWMAVLGMLLSGLVSAQAINEIGGAAPEKTTKANIYRPERDSAPIPRNYEKQPPLIPHSIQGYEVTQNFNKCFDCHSQDRAKEVGATPVGKSHYLTRDNNRLSNISPRRYFCMQCHVPQFDAEPLVENTYKKPAKKN